MELNSNVRAEEILGKNLFDAFPELNRNWLEKKIRSCMVLKTASYSSWQQRPYLFRFKAPAILAQDNEFMYQDASIFPVRCPNGQVEGACIVVHDVTELAEAKRLLDVSLEQTLDLEESNRRDGLTGLYNRKYFDEQITQEVQSARRNGRHLTLAMIDIDHFKHVNDTLGHPAGDTVLRATSVISRRRSLKPSLRRGYPPSAAGRVFEVWRVVARLGRGVRTMVGLVHDQKNALQQCFHPSGQ